MKLIPISKPHYIFLSLLLATCLIVASAVSFVEDTTLTAKEKASLDALKSSIKDKLPKDYFMQEELFLIRWLRKENLNPQKAERAILDLYAWRQRENMDTIQEEDWSDMYQDYKYTLKPRTRDGKPTLYLNIQYWNLRKAAVSGKAKRVSRYIDKVFDEALQTIRSEGQKYKNVSQACLIMNVEGFSLQEHGCLQCVPIVLKIINAYYKQIPGYADRVMVINVPELSYPLLDLFMGVLPQETRDIIQIFGRNRKRWQAELAKYWDKDQLPLELGGNLITEVDEVI